MEKETSVKVERGYLLLGTEKLHKQGNYMTISKKLIISDPNIMMGKPVITGTRITVELILEKLAVGETIEQILEAHPRFNLEAIQAALAFAAKI